jgi:hypothetical protein
MKLPNANNAVVDHEKIADYLLNPVHPDNGGKAGFFLGLGFRREQWKVLAAAFKVLAAASEVAAASESSHGKKFVLVGHIQSPGGKSARVQSIWIVDKGQNQARLITAYPHKV